MYQRHQNPDQLIQHCRNHFPQYQLKPMESVIEIQQQQQTAWQKTCVKNIRISRLDLTVVNYLHLVIFTLCETYRVLPVDKKAKNEPVGKTKVGCITDDKGTNIKTVSGYFERYEICNSTLWFVSFYIKPFSEYNALKQKCSANSFVQPVTNGNKTTYIAIRGPGYFLPARLHVYYIRKSDLEAARISIDKKWMIKDLYQICKKSIKFILADNTSKIL